LGADPPLVLGSPRRILVVPLCPKVADMETQRVPGHSALPHAESASVRAGHAREYCDAGFVAWRVTEQDDITGRSLIFAANHAVRRVRTFPTDWYLLPIAELIRLSWTR
jgi:hypothetical protein